jgi:hypothetical protein
MASTLARFESSGCLSVGTTQSSFVCSSSFVDNQGALHHHVVDACKTVSDYPSIFEGMRQSMMRLVEACIESHGGHFEHLL